MEDIDCVTYTSIVDNLMYVMVCTRPDISQVVIVLSQFRVNPGHEHWVVVKRVFMYLRGNFEYSIFYHDDISRDQYSVDMKGYADSN